ncbi:hypothetical protein BVX97_01325 [bacterium E08(2017)]|nr:hypothetical protein BVX97_01325 [bacterium E08(2017)]
MNDVIKKYVNCKTVVLAVVFLYALLVVGSNFQPPQKVARHGASVPLLHQRLNGLKKVRGPLDKDANCIPLSAMCRSMSLSLPNDAKVFLPNMLGRSNARKLGYYYFMTYYMFPRDVHISLNDDTDYVGVGYWIDNEEAPSEQQLAEKGYHVSVLFADNGQVTPKQLRPMQVSDPKTKSVGKPTDPVIALLLPLVAAISGSWLLCFLIPGLKTSTGWGERFAGGLALSCILIACFVLAFRLMGLRIEKALFYLLILGSVARIALFFIKSKVDPVKVSKILLRWEYILIAPVVVVFYYLFSLAAGLESILEFDAVGAWALKAKMLFYGTGSQIIEWFSSPRYAHAHLEYPLMVPTLHAMTFGAVGNANDFMLKYWPVWMLLCLCLGTLSAFGWPAKNRFVAIAAVCIFLFMPRTLQYVRMEGAVIPMVFFVTMGMLECMFGLLGKNRDRFLLGLLFFFGAAMSKPDGFVFMAAWIAAALMIPSGRKILKPDRRLIILGIICLVAILPFKILRSQVPVLHPQATWVEDGLKNNPGKVAVRAPKLAGVMIARTFVKDDFAKWDAGEGSNLTWSGKWQGAESLFQAYNLGHAWIVLLLGIAAVCICQGRRYPAFIMLGIFFGLQVLLGIVFASLGHSIHEFKTGVGMTGVDVGGRYMYPTIIAVGTAIIALMVDTVGVESESKKS